MDEQPKSEQPEPIDQQQPSDPSDPDQKKRRWKGKRDEDSPASPPKHACGAKSKRSGKPCRAPAMENGRCRLHGGLTPKGIFHHNFKDGRRSKYLPKQLALDYSKSLDDPEILACRDELATLDVTINQAIVSAPSLDTSEDRQHLSELIEKRSKVAEREYKRVVAMGQILTTSQAMALVNHVIGVIRKHVADSRILAAIANDFGKFVLVHPGREAHAGADRQAQSDQPDGQDVSLEVG